MARLTPWKKSTPGDDIRPPVESEEQRLKRLDAGKITGRKLRERDRLYRTPRTPEYVAAEKRRYPD